MTGRAIGRSSRRQLDAGRAARPLAPGAVLLAIGCALAAACSAAIEPAPVQKTGELSFALTVGDGLQVLEATYTLTHHNGIHRSGSIPLSGPSGRIGALFVLPAARSYALSLVATLLDGTACLGSSQFDILPGHKTMTEVVLRCPGPPTLGSAAGNGAAEVSGQLNACPAVDSIAAMPAEAPIGAEIELQAVAADPDGQPASLSLTWSASSGVVADPTAAKATLLCTTAGTAVITLRVSDGDPECDPPAAIVTVGCIAASAAGIAGGGAAQGAIDAAVAPPTGGTMAEDSGSAGADDPDDSADGGEVVDDVDAALEETDAGTDGDRDCSDSNGRPASRRCRE